MAETELAEFSAEELDLIAFLADQHRDRCVSVEHEGQLDNTIGRCENLREKAKALATDSKGVGEDG